MAAPGPEDRYVCIECGRSAEELYRDFNGGILKISHCVFCGQVVDKYVEFDPVLVFLDILLHKPQAYRHVLHNAQIKNHWKFAVLFLFCDAFSKWSYNQSVGENYKTQTDMVFYAALEINFYKMVILAALELLVFFLVLSLTLKVTKSLNILEVSSMSPALSGVLLSMFGKLLIIPAIIWSQTDSDIYLWLTRVFVFTSNVQAIKVLCETSTVLASSIVCMSYIGQYGFSHAVRTWAI